MNILDYTVLIANLVGVAVAVVDAVIVFVVGRVRVAVVERKTGE